jgi:hypothetical protein
MNGSFKDRLKSLFSNDFLIAAVCLIAYLCTNAYVYAWDDQHLEIPLLKHLIDPSLYQGDYYVESLARHFTSYLFPLLAKCIKVDQIPSAYLILFLIARYAMFYWVFKLWHWISKDRFSAFCATLMFFLMGRTEEFLYRTFSHQEFSFIFMFAGIYLFYRERYFLAALIFGLGANIHAIYNLIPMIYMLGFLVLFHPQRWRLSFLSGLIFMAGALPFLCWQIPMSLADKIAGQPVPVSHWLPLYYLSCPQNFLFGALSVKEALHQPQVLLQTFSPYLVLFILYALNWQNNPQFREDKKLHAITIVSVFLTVTNYIFSYIHPSRFVLDLNLIRVEQYVRFFVMGYTTFLIVKEIRISQNRIKVILYSLLWLSLAGATSSATLAGVTTAAVLLQIYSVIQNPQEELKFKALRVFASVIAIGLIVWCIADIKADSIYLPGLWLKFRFIIAALLMLLGLLFYKDILPLRLSLILVPLIACFINFGIHHYDYLKNRKTGTGFWQMQRNWEDMQQYVKGHVPKNAFILTPYDTDEGGFRVGSERRVLVCYRDCGIIGFDYKAAVEWHKRIQDIVEFRMMTKGEGVDKAVLTAIIKYKVDYIVFMNYYAPGSDNSFLKKLYQNEVFSLFKVSIYEKN